MGAEERALGVKLKFLGDGDILPTELSHITKREAREGERLSCQVAVKQNMKIEVEDSVFGVKSGSESSYRQRRYFY